MAKTAFDEITDVQSFVTRCEAAVREMQSDDAIQRYQAYLSLEALIEIFENQHNLDDPQINVFVAFCISACADYFTTQKAEDEPVFRAKAGK